MLIVASLFAFSGCEPQGPTGDITGAFKAIGDITGAWKASWSSMSGSGHSCNLTLTMTLTEQGSAFTGSYTDAMLTCDGQSVPVRGTVVNGTVSSDQVSFDLDTKSMRQTGAVTAGAMSGTATWTLSTSTGTVTLTGNWVATRS